MKGNSQFAQTNSNSEYAGKNVLWAGERSLTNYNQDLIAKLTKNYKSAKDVLEFGAGIGTLASLWEKATQVKPECLEIDPEQRLIIQSRGFTCYENLSSLRKNFDVIYASNVLEHIEDDLQTLRELNAKLKPGGTLMLYVPAFRMLYSELDEKVGHYRRYQRAELLGKLQAAGFTVNKYYFADSLGFFAWLYMKVKGYSSGSTEETRMKIYDRYLFPLSRTLDQLGLRLLFGKNILVFARKD